MTQIPAFMIGRFIQNVLVTPMTAAYDGTLTAAAGYDLAASKVLDGFTPRISPDHAEIHATNATMKNNVITLDDIEVTVREIKASTGYSWLWTVAYNYNYFRIQANVQPPGSPIAYTWAAILNRGEVSDSYDEGKNAVEMQGVACGIPAYFGTGTPPF